LSPLARALVLAVGMAVMVVAIAYSLQPRHVVIIGKGPS
jgi:hypothetical protein